VSGSMAVYLQYLGSPVQIATPAPSDTISYTSFLTALGGKA
jgi:hypothetical protein